jgi:hypothetical protein
MDVKKIKTIIILFLLFNLNIKTHAAVIEVNSTGGGLGTNKLCSLRAAIRAAETDAPFSACVAGSGDDVITLPANSSIVLNQIDNNNVGDNALPIITSHITIEGNDAIIRIPSQAPEMRFFSISQNPTTGDLGHLILKNLTLNGGHADHSGGAIHANSLLHLERVRLENNHADFTGGAISCNSSHTLCVVKSSALINNSANYAGAIDIDVDASLILNQSIVSGNQATIGNGAADGGSVFVSSGHASIINSTIVNNQGGRYGGLLATDTGLPFSTPGTMTVAYSTILNNNPLGVVGNITIKNSVLSGNVGGNCRSFSTVVSDGYNHSDDDSCDFSASDDVINMPVHLEGLVETSQYIQTYPLSYLSMAMDAADPNDCPNADQRNAVRPMDGDNDGLARCDKGAHERVNNMIFIHGFDSLE